MTLQLTRTPADVFAEFLVLNELATRPESQLSWPCYAGSFGTAGDDAVCVYTTAGQLNGRLQRGGKTLQHYGVQVRVRSYDAQVAYAKTVEVCALADSTLRYDFVYRDMQIRFQAISRRSDIIELGEVEEQGRRSHFTVNFLFAAIETPVLVPILTLANGHPFNFLNGDHWELSL